MTSAENNMDCESGPFADGGVGDMAMETPVGLKEISRSGSSVVYTARIGGRRVVVKGLPEEKRTDPSAIAALRKEYALLMDTDHPGIVRVYNIAEFAETGAAIVMEYVEGKSLVEKNLTSRPLAERRRIMSELTEAVAYLHAKGMVHRDLKLSNVMVTRLGHHVKLIDFGLADSDDWWIGKQPAGTPGYASAEQQKSREPDLRNDVYSLGVIMRKLLPERRYGRICSRCLGEASRRYGSAGELLEKLRKATLDFRLLVTLVFVFAISIACLVAISFYHFDSETGQDSFAPQNEKIEPETDVKGESSTAPEENLKQDNIPESRKSNTNNEDKDAEQPRSDDARDSDVLPAELVQSAYAAVDAPLRDALAVIESANAAEDVPAGFSPSRMASQGEAFVELNAANLSAEQQLRLREIIKQRINENSLKWNQAREKKLKELESPKM